MRILRVALAVAMVLGASSVYAGGCANGHADAKSTTAYEETDPRLLALLKKQEEDAAREAQLVNVPN